ncbi:MAG: hypothetical protein ACYCXJ_03190 [Thermoleophilia bacterium]
MDGRGIHTENGSPERRFIAWAAPAAIAVAAIFLRFFALGRDSLWFDELYNVWSARFPLADQMAEGLAAGHPPLYYLIARLWFAVGESEVWVRALSGLSGLLLVWLMYLLGRSPGRPASGPRRSPRSPPYSCGIPGRPPSIRCFFC